MKLKIPQFVALLLCMYVINIHAQTTSKQQPLSIVTYNENVNAALTSTERQQLQEVYGNKLQEYILSKPDRLKAIKNILRNRVEIMELNNPRDQKPCPLLSEIPLFDHYVDGLKRDVSFNKNTFNPLKYNFSFYSRNSYMYRVDNTNYFILIKSQSQR